jgi:hypothetical protein
MKTWSKLSIGAIAIAASACAHDVTPALRGVYVPRGQAAQPASWINTESAASAPALAARHVPRGQAAQPGWSADPAASGVTIVASGVPAGRAAQPGSWIEVAASESRQTQATSAAAQVPARRVQ